MNDIIISVLEDIELKAQQHKLSLPEYIHCQNLMYHELRESLNYIPCSRCEEDCADGCSLCNSCENELADEQYNLIHN
jgi:hypothetical protein